MNTDLVLFFWGVVILSALIFPLWSLFTINKLKKIVTHKDGLIESLGEEVNAMTLASIGVGERVSQLEVYYRKLVARQDQLDLRQPLNQSYKEAISLVKSGEKDHQKLIEKSGLNQSEVELIMMLHSASDGAE